MRGKALLTAFVFCCATVGASHQASAASGNQDLLEQMQKEGWTIVSPGVLKRDLGHGRVETLGFGADGLRFKIQQMKDHLSLLRQDYTNHPTPNVRKAIRAYKTEIERLTQALETAKSIDESEGLASLNDKASGGIDCTIKYGAHVNAFSLTGSSQGVGATTDSYFNSNCGQTGEVYAHSYSKATGADNVIRTATHTEPASGVRSGTNVTANTSDSVVGVRDCYSYSYATMTSYDIGVSYSQSVNNYLCPAPPNPVSLSVSSNYGTAIHIYEYDCATITWTPSASGGTAPYSYTWYNGSTSLGTGATKSKTFCGSNLTTTQTYTITANLTDSTSPTPQTKSASHTTTIYYHKLISDPCASTAGDNKLAVCP
ncbi:MAG TPA: SprB repeat-containing protein [Thermoanaerobaculia bacterium]|nr:SprB repeat-containing protein [Thermoanaerobaculia bacterium]